jgi:hypothetical protein
MTVPGNQWISFKRQFRFERFAYCYYCGMPQDRGSVKESPDCHRQVRWGRGSFCPWSDYVYIVLWCIWHTTGLRASLVQFYGLSEIITYDGFVEWVTEEDQLAGEYYKGLEVFVWFCEAWMSNGRRVTQNVVT